MPWLENTAPFLGDTWLVLGGAPHNADLCQSVLSSLPLLGSSGSKTKPSGWPRGLHLNGHFLMGDKLVIYIQSHFINKIYFTLPPSYRQRADGSCCYLTLQTSHPQSMR